MLGILQKRTDHYSLDRRLLTDVSSIERSASVMKKMRLTSFIFCDLSTQNVSVIIMLFVGNLQEVSSRVIDFRVQSEYNHQIQTWFPDVNDLLHWKSVKRLPHLLWLSSNQRNTSWWWRSQSIVDHIWATFSVKGRFYGILAVSSVVWTTKKWWWRIWDRPYLCSELTDNVDVGAKICVQSAALCVSNLRQNKSILRFSRFWL